MPRVRKCSEPSCDNSTTGTRCRPCYNKRLNATAESKMRTCATCDEPLGYGTKGDHCWTCLNGTVDAVQRVVVEEAARVSKVPATPKVFGDWLILPDPHIPFHHTGVLEQALRDAVLLGVRNLCIPGDLIHADMLSKWVGAAKQIAPSEELVACGRVLGAFEQLFDRIEITVGNHDQRFEKSIARWSETKSGRQALDMVSRILGVDDDAESVSDGVFAHFFGSPKVKMHTLPDIEINGTWLALHPGSCSRVSPQNERKMAEKMRKCVVAGHSHLFGVGFDASGTDIAANIGHTSDRDKYRYIREKPTTFPMTQLGYAFILCDESAPQGRFVPIAYHDRWFTVEALWKRIQNQVGG